MLEPMEIINQQTLSRNLNEILDRISEKRKSALVIKDDRPVAVIFPYEIYQQWTAARGQRLRKAHQCLQTWVSEHEEVLAGLDSTKLIREARDR